MDEDLREGHRDAVDAILDQWRRERPDLDLSAIGVLGRLAQVSLVLGRDVEQVFARHGLRGGEFDVLAALRRSGSPYTLIRSREAIHPVLGLPAEPPVPLKLN